MLKISLLVSILLFQSCSWYENFILINNTNSVISVNYKILGISIFSNEYSVYKLGEAYNSYHEIKIIDSDTTKFGFALNLPPKTSLVFGCLFNDHYKAYNQDFMGITTFNLIEMKIINGGNEIIITPQTFDKFFKKESLGGIKYEVN